MEKRFLIALVLSTIVLIAYPHYMRMLTPQGQPIEVVENGDVSMDVPREEITEESMRKNRIIENIKNEEKHILSTQNLDITFSNVGASIEEIALNTYEQKDGTVIQLLKEADGVKSGNLLFTKNRMSTEDYLFSVTSSDDRQITYEGEVGTYHVRKRYTMTDEPYLIMVDIAVKNTGKMPIEATYEFRTDICAETSSRYEGRFIQFSVLTDDKVKSTHFGKVQSKGALYEDAVEWSALRTKYFSIFTRPDFAMEHVRADVVDGRVMRSIVKTPHRELAVGETITDSYTIYMGPKGYTQLRDLGLGFEKVFSGGFWGLFRIALLMLLYFFYNIFHNYGLAIIALTITIKILFIPLTHKSFASMKKMQEVQPQMKALQEKHKEDPQKLNKEVMELYKKNKVNPLGGCFPLLLQMPIFIALYQVLSEAVELRGAPFFGWIKDLSEADRLIELPFTVPLVNIDAINILPLLMIGSMIWQQKLTSGTSTQMKEQQQMMMMMPIVFGFIFYNLPSGLVLYWLLNNVLTIVHQLYSHKMHPTPQTT